MRLWVRATGLLESNTELFLSVPSRMDTAAPSSMAQTSSPSDTSEECHCFLRVCSFRPFPKLKLRFRELAPEFTKSLNCFRIEKLLRNRPSCDGDSVFLLPFVPDGFFSFQSDFFFVSSLGGGVVLVAEAFCWPLDFFEDFREVHAASNWLLSVMAPVLQEK